MVNVANLTLILIAHNQHKHKKVKESLEFSEAERAVLLDSNMELESQLKMFKGELEETRHALERAKWVHFAAKQLEFKYP